MKALGNVALLVDSRRANVRPDGFVNHERGTNRVISNTYRFALHRLGPLKLASPWKM